MNRQQARERAEALVAQMTLEEKASQLRYNAPAIPRLDIPEYNWWNESLHGVARGGTATMFPQAIGMAASFDSELMEEIGDCISTEGRARYNEMSKRGDRDIYKGLTFWSPNVNIFRDPRWGRGHETYGEDPYLAGTLGVSFIHGIQGDGEYMKAAACAKHFAVHSGPEAIRHSFDAKASKKDMEETYLAAFETCVKDGGVEAVMGAYNRVNGEPACASKTLLQDTLRDKWGFEGHVVSDCWALRDIHENHKVTKTVEESAKLALEMGCDLNCGCTYESLLSAVDKGLVSEETITRSCVRLFTTRILLGLFDKTPYDTLGWLDVATKEHEALAHRAALESMVLLKNNGILPLRLDDVHTVGVIGPNANSRSALIGNYHGTAQRYVTVLEGLQEKLPQDVRVLYSQGCHLWKNNVEPLSKPSNSDRLAEAKTVCDYSDVVVLVVGLDETLEGEEGDTGNSDASGDKKDLRFPGPQRELMKAVLDSGKPVIFVNMTGSAMDLKLADEKAAAILQAWYPGALGGVDVADVLLGNASPSGKLPVTFYEDTKDLPDFEDYSMKNRTYRYFTGTPLYPFGYGLTYGHLDVVSATVDEKHVVHATIRNTQTLPCEDVLQVYIKDEDSAFAVLHPSLCGFARVSVQPGEEKDVLLSLPDKAFTSVNEEGVRDIFGKNFSIYVGFSQPDERSAALTKQDTIKIPYHL
ncbi:MAG: glycoside hydrolase family 3 C-terminal domain-containing protein [Lachnospiraceae bacterium]|nr:glycoside hydrolase family 3 C-terminal domain-containing protein [Lachnospiraceae bacterium]